MSANDERFISVMLQASTEGCHTHSCHLSVGVLSFTSFCDARSCQVYVAPNFNRPDYTLRTKHSSTLVARTLSIHTAVGYTLPRTPARENTSSQCRHPNKTFIIYLMHTFLVLFVMTNCRVTYLFHTLCPKVLDSPKIYGNAWIICIMVWGLLFLFLLLIVQLVRGR